MAGAGGDDDKGLTEEAMYEALSDLGREGSRIGTHEPISARTTGSSTTEATGDEPVMEDVAEETAVVEEVERDPSKGKTPITETGGERQGLRIHSTGEWLLYPHRVHQLLARRITGISRS